MKRREFSKIFAIPVGSTLPGSTGLGEEDLQGGEFFDPGERRCRESASGAMLPGDSGMPKALPQ